MAAPAPPPPFAELDARLPIVLLPVRIETRYFDVNPDLVELRVRIFPSQAHVTTNRTTVDLVERDEIVTYWRTRRTAGATAAATDRAWQRVVGLFGEPRAQRLRRLLTPTAAPDGSLVFPEVPLTPAGASEADNPTEATALPTRFFAVGYENDTRQFAVSGAKVPARVPVGSFASEEAVRWQTDFAAAEAIGLALRVTIPRAQAARLTRLFVYGVREGAAASSSTAALQSLLERHAHSEGAALLPAGSPTNHTPMARVEPPLPASGSTPRAGTDGARLAAALGLTAGSFAPVGGAANSTDPAVQAMHTALWPATLGYFLDDVMDPVFSAAAITRGLNLFRDHVRPRGPWPTLALGSQPYGVLPVSSLAAWRTAEGAEDPLARGLNALRSGWIKAAAKVPRLSPGAELSSALVDVLAQSPISTRWFGRTLETHQTARRWFGDLVEARWQRVLEARQRAMAAATLRPLGITGTPRGLDFVFDNDSFGLRAPLVAPPDADRNAPLAANYIQAIAAATVDQLKTDAVTGSTPRSLLYLLLRHSTLLAMARTADRFQTQRLRELVFIASTDKTVWTRLKEPVAELGNRPLTEVLAGELPTHPALIDITQHREALKTLAAAPVKELERLTAEAIDACSYRLDAWITALAGERLAAMRAARPRGLHLGAYAWVDAPPLPSVLPREGGATIVDPDSEGYIHAPRLALARTAAVLRGAFLAREQESAQAPLLIDLSSSRVRGARWLLAGVRNGASLAALLGTRIERWLIARRLGPQIAPLRDRFSVIDGSGRRRIDGLALSAAWRAAPPPANLQPIARQLEDLLDAAADLLLAEAVHQHASGNPGRAQKALAALETGTGLPDEFDVVRTEGDSTSRTWRLVLPVAPDALEAWMAGILGPLDLLQATVHPASPPTVTMPVAALGISHREMVDLARDSADAPALATRFADAAGGGTVTFEPELKKALVAANAISQLVRGSRPLEDGDLGASGETRAPIPDYERSSKKKEWLHDAGRLRPAVDALDTLDYFLRAQGRDAGIRFYDSGGRITLVSIGELPAAGPVNGLLIDGWNEKTPGLEATTGIAIHYDAPGARAPQAILLMVPPNPQAGWSDSFVEAALAETAVLSQIRMVRPSDVDGPFLPALYLAENLAGDTVSTNFFEIAAVTSVKEQA